MTQPPADADDFYEEDEPVAKILEVWRNGERHLTAPPLPEGLLWPLDNLPRRFLWAHAYRKGGEGPWFAIGALSKQQAIDDIADLHGAFPNAESLLLQRLVSPWMVVE